MLQKLKELLEAKDVPDHKILEVFIMSKMEVVAQAKKIIHGRRLLDQYLKVMRHSHGIINIPCDKPAHMGVTAAGLIRFGDSQWIPVREPTKEDLADIFDALSASTIEIAHATPDSAADVLFSLAKEINQLIDRTEIVSRGTEIIALPDTIETDIEDVYIWAIDEHAYLVCNNPGDSPFTKTIFNMGHAVRKELLNMIMYRGEEFLISEQ